MISNDLGICLRKSFGAAWRILDVFNMKFCLFSNKHAMVLITYLFIWCLFSDLTLN